jgi:K+-transporting ATPase ATPase C chain
MSESKEAYESSHKTTREPAGSFIGHLWASIAVTVTLGVICCGIYPLVVYGIAQAVFPAQANGSLVKKDGTYTTKDEEAVGSSLLGQNFSLPGYFHPRPSAAGNGYDPTSSGGSNLGPLSDKLINGATQAPATQPTTAPTDASATTAPAATTSPATVASTAPATQPAETLAFDGVRLRTIHYAVDNGLSFKLYNVSPDGSRAEVPLSKFLDSSGNLIDTALVDAFPHPPTDTADRVVLVAGDFKNADGTTALIPGDAVTGSGSGLDPHISPANAQFQAQRVADARHIGVDKVKEMIEKHTDYPSLGIFGDPGVNVLMLNLALDNAYPIPAPAPTSTAPATQPASK